MSSGSVRPGDIAAGIGYIGIVADLPAGMVGLALFDAPGRQRRIVYVASEKCQLVKRSWEWQSIDTCERDTAEGLYRLQNSSVSRER